MSTPLNVGQLGFLQHRAGDLIKGRYEVLQRLGGGNFGSVYRVRDRALDHDLACKEMHVLDNPDSDKDERGLAIEFFKREALNLATLRHPHIPAAYFDQEEGVWHVCPFCGFDYALENPDAQFCPVHGTPLLRVAERYYLMMDFVDGPTLEDLTTAAQRQNKTLDEKTCLEWAGQIASALRVLHRVGIIHRDVKPENIKIRKNDGTAMLLDFGLTRKVEEASGYGTVRLTGTSRFGTPGYAPANMMEVERPERRTDIYALGMTLYRILTGRDPQDEEEQAEMRAYSPRYFNPQISPEADRLIRQATALDITRRHQTIEAFLDELSNIQGTRQAAFSAPPFTFSTGQSARTPGELARLIESRPQEAQGYLFDGLLADWLKQSGFAAPAKVAADAILTHKNQPQRALELVRRALYPGGAPGALPAPQTEPQKLNFGTLDSGEGASQTLRIVHDSPGLAWGEIAVEGGAPELPGLVFEEQFEGNDVTLKIMLDTGKVPPGHYQGALLVLTDAASHRVPVSYRVQALDLTIEPPQLNFGAIAVGQRSSRTLQIKNNGKMGRPRGAIHAPDYFKGLQVPERFEGETPLEVVIDARAPGTVAGYYEGSLRLDTNGGTLRVPVHYVLTLPPLSLLFLLFRTMLYGALGGLLLRLSYGLVNPELMWAWLTRYDGAMQLEPLRLNSWAPILAGAIGGVEFMRRAQKVAPKALQPILPLIAIFGGVVGIWVILALGHWVLWGLGDFVLHPLALAVGQHTLNAPQWWGLSGIVIGFFHGLGRVLVALGKPWGFYLAPALLFPILLILMIHAASFSG
ncbi:MAG TPA: serine/threonine-protein kinase [Abditibacteriaceae bacterium]